MGEFRRRVDFIFVTPSTAKNGAISAIVPKVSHEDHSEHSVKIVVSEYGVADLRGKVKNYSLARLFPIFASGSASLIENLEKKTSKKFAFINKKTDLCSAKNKTMNRISLNNNWWHLRITKIVSGTAM